LVELGIVTYDLVWRKAPEIYFVDIFFKVLKITCAQLNRVKIGNPISKYLTAKNLIFVENFQNIQQQNN
jgi:hypothetical protein